MIRIAMAAALILWRECLCRVSDALPIYRRHARVCPCAPGSQPKKTVKRAVFHHEHDHVLDA